MSDNTNICLPCGLCCDGTLIGFVQLEHKEVPRLRALMEIEEGHGEGFILHPCKSFCGECTIYDDRPKQCDHFKCGLLKSVEKGELAFNSAVETIHETKEMKTAIERKVEALGIELKSPSFYFKMNELEKLYRKNAVHSRSAEFRELMADIAELNRLLVHKFKLSLFFEPEPPQGDARA